MITSPAARAASQRGTELRRRLLVGKDHRAPRGMVRVTVVPFPCFDSSSTVPAVRLDELARQRQAEAQAPPRRGRPLR